MSDLQLCQAERHLVPRAAEGSPVAPRGDAQFNAGHEAAEQSMVILVMSEKIKQVGEISIDLLDKDCWGGKSIFSGDFQVFCFVDSFYSKLFLFVVFINFPNRKTTLYLAKG